MNLQALLNKSCVQDAVYWDPTGESGYGKKTYAAPIQIKCRWEQRDQTLTDPKGSITGSRAAIFVLQDLKDEGFIFEGTLDQLTTEQKNNPTSMMNAWQIRQFEKIPELGSTTNFIRKAYLLIWQRR